MGYISTGMGDHFSELLVFLMALWLVLVDGNPLFAIMFVETNIQDNMAWSCNYPCPAKGNGHWHCNDIHLFVILCVCPYTKTRKL